MSGPEAYGTVSGEMYYEDEIGYEPPDQVLASLESEIVATAKAFAEEVGLPWPPRPSGAIAWIGSNVLLPLVG